MRPELRQQYLDGRISRTSWEMIGCGDETEQGWANYCPRPYPASIHFCTAPVLGTVFIFYKWLKKNKRERIFCDILKLCEIQTSVSISTVSLEHSHAGSSAYHLWPQGQSCVEARGPAKSKIFTICLFEKSCWPLKRRTTATFPP